jgi:hypothetical protein
MMPIAPLARGSLSFDPGTLNNGDVAIDGHILEGILSSYEVDVVNTTVAAMQALSLTAKVYSLENKLLFENTRKVLVNANALTPGFTLEFAPSLSTGMVFVRVNLNDALGKDFG